MRLATDAKLLPCFLATVFGIPLDHHNAASDAWAAAEVVLKAAREAEATNVNDLIARYGIGVGDLNAEQLNRLSGSPFIRAIRDDVDIELPDDFDFASHKFYGKQIAFTGTLKTFTRRQAFSIVSKFQGTPSESVNQSTSILVTGWQDITRLAAGESESSKLRKAKKMRDEGHGIEIITDDDFFELIFGPTKQGTDLGK